METKLVVILICMLQGSTSVLFLSGPPRPVAIGTGADYVCSSENANIDISSIQWIINNMSLEDLNLPNVAATSFNGRALLFVNDLSMDFNETTVQCRANNSGTIINSNMIKLLVQGPPSAIGSLSATTLNPYTISLTWTLSFTLNILNPDITYCISVEVNITASSSVTRSECDITTNAYNYTINPNEGCGFYRFTVTPMNRLGNGSAVTHAHLMESSVMSEGRLVPVFIVKEVYTYSIHLSAPACVSGLTFVDRDTGERMNKNLITGNATITFTTKKLKRNRQYNVTVNAINVQSSATTIISTHGIENTTTETNGDAGISIDTNYFRNSSAIGALYILIFVSGDQVMNLSYRSFGRDESRESIHLMPYLVLAYDIENDGVLYDGDGVSFPASINNPGIDRGSSPLIRDSISCTVTTTHKNISARCNDSDSDVTGFQMIVQSADLAHVGKLMITRTNDTSSMMRLQVNISGEHIITVFSIRRGSMMDYNSIAYRTRMMIDIPVTTSTLSSTPTTTTSTKSGVKGIAVAVPAVLVVVVVVVVVVLVYAYCIRRHRFKVKPKARDDNIYYCTTADGGQISVERNDVSPSNSENNSNSSSLSEPSAAPLLQRPSSNEDKEPVPSGGVEGNYVETLVSGSSVGPPITTGRSEYGEIKGELNKQGQFYERVQVKPAVTNRDKVIDFHDVEYASINHTKQNTTRSTTPTD